MPRVPHPFASFWEPRTPRHRFLAQPPLLRRCISRAILAPFAPDFELDRSEQAMATPSAVPARSHRIHLRHVLVAVLVPMFLFVLWHDERFILAHSDEKWRYYFPVRWLVLIHALAGLTALVIGPFQLSSRFRERHLSLHRVMGRVYLSCVTIAGLMGIYVSTIHQKDLQDRLWILALAVTWLVTGAMAFAAVRNGNIDVHRQWIIRNYAFTSVFVTVRVLNALPIPDAYAQSLGWILLLATLLLTDVGLSWRNVFTNRRQKPATLNAGG